jgi:hypothetical protein
MSEEQIRSTITYIMKGRDYKAKVARANLAEFTFLPPYDPSWQPRGTNLFYRTARDGRQILQYIELL